MVREDEIYDWFIDKQNEAICEYSSKPFEFVRKIIRSLEHYIGFIDGRGNDGKSNTPMETLKRLCGGSFSLHYVKRTLRFLPTPKGQSANPAEGLLTFIDNGVDLQSGAIKLKATFQNKDNRLWPGEFVNVVLNPSTVKNAITVPTNPVQSGQQGIMFMSYKRRYRRSASDHVSRHLPESHAGEERA